MKKLFLLCFFVIAMVSFSGCGKVIELTDEEYYMIAEYSADLLIKYDKDIKSKYNEAYLDSLDSEEITTEVTTTEFVQNDTSEVTSEEETEATTEEITDKNTETSVDDNKESSTEEKIEVTTEEQNTTGDLEANVNKNFDIAEFAGIDSVSIKYAYYAILAQYPSYDKEGKYIEITAPEGYKFFVVKFDVENKTNDSQYIDMFSADLSYQIVINDQKSARQMLTILTDDLYTYQADIGGSMRQETVLLFQISDDVVNTIQGIKLKVSKNDDTKIMQLQ